MSYYLNGHIPGKKVSSVGLPVINEKLFNALVLHRENLEPGQGSPDAILLTNMIRSGTEKKIG